MSDPNAAEQAEDLIRREAYLREEYKRHGDFATLLRFSTPNAP